MICGLAVTTSVSAALTASAAAAVARKFGDKVHTLHTLTRRRRARNMVRLYILQYMYM